MKLHIHRWTPSEPPQALVAIAHGYGEHGARYAPMAERFVHQGIATYACDFRGHGRSPGPRGDISCFDTFVEDYAALVNSVQSEFNGRPLFLLGHSLGALFVAHYVLKHRPTIRGLIFSSGALKIGEDVSPTLQRLSWLLHMTVPWLPAVPIRPQLTSRIPDAVQRYANDPLNLHTRMRVRTGYQILVATRAFEARAAEITAPVLFLHGTEDKLTDPEGSRACHTAVGSADKTLKLYDGAYHEMLHDVNSDEFLDDITAWIAARFD